MNARRETGRADRPKRLTHPLKPNPEALKLPDQLLVRYYSAGEIDQVAKVETGEDQITVVVRVAGDARTDRWTDLGGGLGFVPVE
jgi:hypothetical protein